MAKRLVEVFTAGCPVCDKAVKQVEEMACANCEVKVYDINKKADSHEYEEKVKQYGIEAVPAVAIEG